MKPTIGRIVHYVDEDGQEWPAIISRVHSTIGEYVDIHVFERFACIAHPGVPHDEMTKGTGSWHWPEREE